MMNAKDPIKIEDESNSELNNMEFQTEGYEHQYCAQTTSDEFTNAGSSLNVCGLCGIVGKLFIKLKENEDLISKINKYMPFIDAQNHFSDSICYSCSSQVNSWNGFYLHCSSINSKLNKQLVISDVEGGSSNSNKKQKKTSNTSSVDQINKSYKHLDENPCTENVARTMDVLTNCLKSLISQLKTSPSNYADSCEVTVLDGSNEESDSNFGINGLMKPFDVIEVDIAESDIISDSNNKWKLKSVRQVYSHHGIIFCDDEGHAYRVNKKQPGGKLYVRCADNKCPVRGSIVGSSFRSNKHDHTHSPRPIKNGRFLVSDKEKVTTSSEADVFTLS